MRASTLALLVHGPAVAAAFVHGGGSPASPASPALLRPRTVAAAATTTAADDTTAKQAAFDEVVMKTYGRYPITMVKGKGAHLWDSTGKEYIDFVAGISTCSLGHSNEGLTAAVAKQMSEMHHVSNLYYIPGQGDLAAWLVSRSCADKAFFCNSGAEANEGAIKLARKHAHTKRGIDKPVIITALSSFHGRTLAAITATAQPKYQQDFDYGGKMVEGFEYVPYNDVEALKAKVKEINKRSLWSRIRGKKRGVAAIMLEALQGEGGIQPGTEEYFKVAREICDETGALLMCDEVQVGMGRSGKMWGFENLNIEPDVFTIAKALGGGVPIGAMLCKSHCNVFGPGDHATTFGGNPLACAAGLQVAKAIDEENLLENVAARGAQLRAGLEAIQKEYPEWVKDIRGWGLITGLEISQDQGVTAGEVVGAAIKEGLLLVPAGTHVVRFVPPLIVTEKDVTDALAIFSKVVASYAKK